MDEFITTKVRRKTLKELRLIYGLTGERQTNIVARLVAAELERVKREDKTGTFVVEREQRVAITS